MTDSPSKFSVRMRRQHHQVIGRHEKEAAKCKQGNAEYLTLVAHSDRVKDVSACWEMIGGNVHSVLCSVFPQSICACVTFTGDVDQ